MTELNGYWLDEVSHFRAATEPEQVFSLADGRDRDVLRLELIDRAQSNGASWTVIGRTLGMRGPEAKRYAKKLRAQVRRAALLSAEEDG